MILFFAGDSFFAMRTPFLGGGLKVGTQTLKSIIEKDFLRINNEILSRVSVKFNLEIVEWSLGEIIFENIFNKPAKEYIIDFLNSLGLSSLHGVFSNIFD